MARFVPVDRETQYLFPPSVQEWLPEDHLARFIVDVVEQLDLSALEQSYAGRGSDAHHPAMLVALLLYGYATGTLLQPSPGTGELRLDRGALHHGEHASGSRHDQQFPPAVPEADRGDLRPGAVLCPGDGDVEAGYGQPGWHQGARQRFAPQGDELRLRQEVARPSSRRRWRR